MWCVFRAADYPQPFQCRVEQGVSVLRLGIDAEPAVLRQDLVLHKLIYGRMNRNDPVFPSCGLDAALEISLFKISREFQYLRKLYNDSTSDVRLKKNFEDCEVNALDAVCKMPVCSFDWKENGVHQPLGLVADDLEKIDSLLALGGGYNEDGSINAKQIDRLLLTEYAIKAIQELSAKVDEQEKRIKELERRLQNGKI